MKILTEKGVLDLTEDFSIQIDNKSPINNDQASQSVPVTVPATPNNARITDFPFRPDLAVVPMGGDAPCVVQRILQTDGTDACGVRIEKGRNHYKYRLR